MVLTPMADITDRKPAQYKSDRPNRQQHGKWLLGRHIADLLKPAARAIQRFTISSFHGPGGLVTFTRRLG